MPFQKGKPRTGGRKKGSVNKTTADVRNAIIEAFHMAGGATYLNRLSKSHPQVFCALVGKVVPSEVNATLTGKDGGPIITEVTIEHHGIPAAIVAPDGGSEGRQADAEIPSGAIEGVAVNGAVPAHLGGYPLGEDIVVPVVAAPGNKEPWIR